MTQTEVSKVLGTNQVNISRQEEKILTKLNKKLVDLVPYDPIMGTYKIRLDANESCFDLSDSLGLACGFHVKVDVLAYAQILQATVAHTFQRGGNSLALRVKHAFLEKNKQTDSVSHRYIPLSE